MKATSLGRFAAGPIQIDEETGHKFRAFSNEDGLDFHMDIARAEAQYDGPNFISAQHPFYAAVRRDGTIRVVSNEPSRVQPEDGELFIWSDEEIAPEMAFDVNTGEVTEGPYRWESDGWSDLPQLQIYLLRKGVKQDIEEALSKSRAANAEELRIYWQHGGSMGYDHPLLQYVAKRLGVTKDGYDDFYRELRATR